MKEENNIALQALIIAIKLLSQHSFKWGEKTKINTSERKQVVFALWDFSKSLFLKTPEEDKPILQTLELGIYSVSGSDLGGIFTIFWVFDLWFLSVNFLAFTKSVSPHLSEHLYVLRKKTTQLC